VPVPRAARRAQRRLFAGRGRLLRDVPTTTLIAAPTRRCRPRVGDPGRVGRARARAESRRAAEASSASCHSCRWPAHQIEDPRDIRPPPASTISVVVGHRPQVSGRVHKQTTLRAACRALAPALSSRHRAAPAGMRNEYRLATNSDDYHYWT